jgi:type IV pilus assembly protein PilY1
MKLHLPLRLLSRIAALSLLLAGSATAQAALTDLADGPLVDAGAVIVKPNILFTLDDSGSMSWSYMPDEVGYPSSNWSGAVGYRSHLCNKIYYNPALTYLPAKTTAGVDASDVSFTAAPYNGFVSGSSPVNLSTSFQAFTPSDAGLGSCNGGGSGNCGSDTAQAAYYYKYTGSNTTPTSSECATTASSAYPHTPTGWEKVRISTTAEKTNFANWYTYYRTRMQMMKASAGRAFAGLSDRYRVGFITIKPMDSGTVSSDYYLPVADFTTTQKTNWLTKLYAAPADSGTPLREALSRAGRYFAGKTDGINAGMTPDPVQYSCQQNFTILTTDGYWNGNAGQLLDGTTSIGNQDATESKPMWDGGAAVNNTVFTRTRTSYYLNSSGCGSGQRKIRMRVDTVTVTNNVEGSYVNGSASDYAGCGTNSTSRLPTTGLTGPVTCSWVSTSCTYKTEDGASSVVATTSGGSSDTLSDVAEYYYKTDLRTSDLSNCIGALGSGINVCTNNVFGPTSTSVEDDTNKKQHMTTFTLGLGVSGQLTFDSEYKTQTTGDFAALRAGTTNSAGLTYWPIPDNAQTQTEPKKSDDLWHTAVDGRGRAFSASNPFEVSQGLVTALSEINARTGAASAAAASNLDIVTGDNLIYIPRYTTAKWTGDLLALEIDLSTITVDSSKVIFSSATKLNAQVQNTCDNRNIYLFRSGATNNLTPFTSSTTNCATSTSSTGLNATELAYFNATNIALLSQYSGMSSSQKSDAVGSNLVNFLRGQRGKEGFTQGDDTTLYRTRESVMGDVIGGAPLHIRAPFADYTDTGYADFKVAQASRYPIIYVPANDGMLHAFYAGQIQKDSSGATLRNADGTPQLDANAGKEAWAFIPTSVLPNLYKLADTNYANLHQFYVDGAPTSGDAYLSSAWKTILVGGLNKGGRGYYALDITNPSSPKALWEFKYDANNCVAVGSPSTAQYTDCHLGYTYGNPVIAKQSDGTWVVIVASGYNNVNATTQTGDGVGYLYVLSALDGHIIRKISTGAGSATTPSGLAKITAWVDKPKENNTALRVYGGDLLGNVWRFDINDGSSTASKLATLTDSGGTAQPVMTKPVLSQVGSPPEPIVFVGTGKYLGAADLSTTQTQSIYAIIDRFGSSITPRSTLAQRTITANSGTATVSCGTGGCTAPNGWYADFPNSKERVNIGPRVELGTLVVATGIPENDACSPGGKSWVYYFDYDTGSFVPGVSNSQVGSEISNAMVVGLTIVKINGKPTVLTTTNDGTTTGGNPDTFSTGAPSGTKVQWRELLVE